MEHRDACYYCTRRHSCFDRYGQCSQFVDRREIRRKLIELGIIVENPRGDTKRSDRDGGAR